MAIQKEILSVKKDGSTPKYIDAAGAEKTDKTLQGSVGILALGKPGDIMTRAYGPVVRALPIVAADIPVGGITIPFGTYVDGKGILVNSNDCDGVGDKFDTVYGLKAGQVGSFLVSGACVVKCSAVEAIAAGMKVQDIIGYQTAEGTVCEIEVNGFDTETPVPSSDL